MMLPTIDFALIIKILFLVLIALYAVFVVVVYINVRSLSKLVLVQRTSGSPLFKGVTLAYLLLTIFLFVLALVIL